MRKVLVFLAVVALLASVAGAASTITSATVTTTFTGDQTNWDVNLTAPLPAGQTLVDWKVANCTGAPAIYWDEKANATDLTLDTPRPGSTWQSTGNIGRSIAYTTGGTNYNSFNDMPEGTRTNGYMPRSGVKLGNWGYYTITAPSSTEERILTLYGGIYAQGDNEPGRTASITAVLTDGTLITPIALNTDVAGVWAYSFDYKSDTTQTMTITVGDGNYDANLGFQAMSLVTVPEPATMTLLALGGIGALLRRRRA